MIGTHITRHFDQTWEHWQYATVVDPWGGTTTSWVKQDDINLSFRPLSGDHVIRDSADTVVMSAKFYMAAGESAAVGDELRNGDTYEITAVIDPMAKGEFLQVEGRLK